jgi:hypothetical protein
MFPNPENGPTCLKQCPFHRTVALLISAKLGQPIVTVAAGFSSMLRTAVPEAAVNKHGEAFTPKDEVGVARDWLPSAPARDTASAKNRHQPELRVFVTSRADDGHHLRTLHFGKNIWHLTDHYG